MLKIGSHVSINGGLIAAAKEAHSYGANTFMIYTGAPQNTRRSPISNLKIEEGRKYMDENGLVDFVVHAPYIINLASYKDDTHKLAKDCLTSELERTAAVGSNYLVLHPGSYTDKTYEEGLQRIIDGLNEVLTEDTAPTICLETMAGKGKEIGRTFEELKDIIDGVKLNHKLGVCFDTCHVHDGGYDIVNNLDGVLEEFDKVIGLDRLKVLHINGSMNPMGAHKDRHAHIGADDSFKKGPDYIGKKALYNVVHHPLLEGRPFILETPWLDSNTNFYKEEIAFLRSENPEF